MNLGWVAPPPQILTEIRMIRPILALLAAVFCTATWQDGDLRSLAARYRRAARRVSGPPQARADKVAKLVQPILDEIGEIDSDESLGFLLGELNKAPLPEIAAACARPILESSSPRATELILVEFSRRPQTVQQAILQALAGSGKDLKKMESRLLAISKQRLAPAVKTALPGVLGKLDTVGAARVLIGQLKARRNVGRGGDSEEKYKKAAIEALEKTENPAVKKWLSSDAFATARSDPARLAVVATLAGKLKLTDARKRLVKLVGHKSTQVAVAAVLALSLIGVGDEAKTIARTLERRRGAANREFRIQAMDSLATSGDEEALRIVLRYAGGKDVEMRAIAMGSLALVPENSAALNALLRGLKDENQNVRFVTLRSLSRLRDKAMISPLIEALGGDGAYAFRVQVLKLLVRLTGQNMGLVETDWRKWWEVAGARFKLPERDEKGFTSVEAYDLEYFGIEVSSKRLSFLVDNSSSMMQKVPVKKRDEEEKEDSPRGGTVVDGGDKKGGGKKGGGKKTGETEARKIDVLKRELVLVLKKLPADTFVNIVKFDAQFHAWQKQLQPLRGRGRAKAVKYVESLNTGQGTNVFDTIEFALKDERVDTIYLLTDGLPSRGRITDPEAIIKEVAKLNRLRAVTIHCIAFGEESDLLKKLAADNGGEYRFVDEY